MSQLRTHVWSVDGMAIATIAIPEGCTVALQRREDPVKPVYLGYPHGPADAGGVREGRLAVTHTFAIHCPSIAEVTLTFPSTDDSFPCEVGDSLFLRTAVGMPANRRDHAIYDRAVDSLLCVDVRDSCSVLATEFGYEMHLSGQEIRLSWKPDYYRNHLGYFLWQPSRRLWREPVAGWCSWMAHGQDVTEQDMLDAATFFAENLLDRGYDVIQMDDGFQRVPQVRPEAFETVEPFHKLWIEADKVKFPTGLPSLARTIASMGLTPGIWVGMYTPLKKGFEGYVTGEDGNPYRGPWVNYAADATSSDAVDEAYLQTIRGLKEQGWRYFKLDTLRHVLYDSYRLNEHFWEARATDSTLAFRALFEQYREAVGDDVYCLACWGTLPEIAGLPAGCRIGEDVGPNWKSIELVGKYIAQFHYLNNVVWLNDPDYMCFDMPIEQCRFWASLLALTCCQLMVSDPVHLYDQDRVDILRRIGPPMLGRPRVLNSLDCKEFCILQVQDGETVWTLVGRFAWEDVPQISLSLKDLGLDPGSYFAWDFWGSTKRGEVSESLKFQTLGAGGCEVISLHPAEDRPFAWPARS